MSILLILVLTNMILLATIVKTQGQPPIPRNVEGRVFTNASNGVQNGIPVRINSTTTLDSVLVYTDAPDIPELRGSYSTTIRATNGEVIIGWAWNSTYYGTNTTTIQGGTTNLNFILNISRPSEANVTILYPPNDTLKNKTVTFNITANISMLGSDGVDCNATIRFSDNSTLNITAGDNLTHFLDDIPRGSFKVTNWSVAGLKDGSSNVTIRADCASDGIKLDRVNQKTIYNISVQNLPPSITRIYVNNPLDLEAGNNLTVLCNISIFEPNTVADIQVVNATLFKSSTGKNSQDDNNNHYTNISCKNYSSNLFEANFSCGFKVAYYADNGTWFCNASVQDFSNASSYINSSFLVNELLAIDVSPSVIDFGSLQIGNSSSTDVNISVRNLGNMPINATIRGFAPNASLAYLNLSMTCPRGNITNNNTRFSVNNGTSFDSMQPMSNISQMLNMTLYQRTNDLISGNDTNFTYWKVMIPPLTLGACNGTVIFSAIPIA